MEHPLNAVRVVNVYTASDLCRMRLNYDGTSMLAALAIGRAWTEPAELVDKGIGATSSEGCLVFLDK